MKIKFTFKLLSVITCLLLTFNLQAKTATVHVATAGTLFALIDDRYLITELIVTGKLNGDDMLTIREMAGSDEKGYATAGMLAILNLEGANIVPGGYHNTGSDNTIRESAFYKCKKLTSVTIPNSITSIGSSAFSGCTGLTSVNIPNSVTSIGYSAFEGCTGLSVNIPNSVTSIGSSAFSGCTGLTSVNIPNGVTSIGWATFWGCTGLTSVNIPNSVTSIGTQAFCDCGLTSVTIGNNVTSIGSSAFSGCTGLTSVTIPNSVTFIGSSAFEYCYNLTEIHSKKTTPPGLNPPLVSSQIEKTCKLYVPKGSLSAYRSAYYWRNFVNIIEEDDATAIDNVSTQNLSVYPNPAKHDLFIRSDSPIEKIDLYNQLGQLVLKATDFVEKIDVSHLEAGIYFVRIIVDGTVVTKKIVVK